MSTADAGSPRVLVACMGNVLRGDDGFGVAVAERLAAEPLPPSVTLLEVGIGGMHVVQELLEGYEALILVDAVDRGAAPGSIFVLEPSVPDPRDLEVGARRELLADMHQTVPSRVLMMAKGLGALPERVWMVGCQPGEVDEPGLALSASVRAAVVEAADRIRVLLDVVGADAAVGRADA